MSLFSMKKAILLIGVLTAIPTYAGPDMPSHVRDIQEGGFACTVINNPVESHDYKTGRLLGTFDSYEAHAHAKYNDNLYPEYKRVLGIYPTIRPAVDDCTNWFEAVKRARRGQ